MVPHKVSNTNIQINFFDRRRLSVTMPITRKIAGAAVILSAALFVSSSTAVVNSFHIKASRVSTATHMNSSYHELLKKSNGSNKNEDMKIGGYRFPHLFAVSFDNILRRKQGLMSFLFRISSSLLRRSTRFLFQLRTLAASLAIFFLVNVFVLPAWAVPSNGRMGGSFGISNRYGSTPSSRIQPSKANRKIPSRSRYLRRTRIYNNFHQENGEQVTGDGVAIMTNSNGTTSYVRKVSTHPFSNSRFSASDIVLVSGVTATVTNGLARRRSDRKRYDDNNLDIHPLGPGISVWCMTACFDVPDINDPTSIVRRLQKLAEKTSTETRKGLQKMLAETSLELLRQLDKGSITSVETRYDHYRMSDKAVVRAERQFNRISTNERRKFDTESWSSYNGDIVSDDTDIYASNFESFEATSSLALVQIHLIIEGQAMKFFGHRQMETKRSFQAALLQLSGDVSAVEDCVLAGEVLWSPHKHERGEVITEEDVYATYPTLWPIDYSSM